MNSKMKNFLSVIFLIFCCFFGYFFTKNQEWSIFVILAIILWVYMAMNIWANDVANSVWPAVWSKTISLKWAIIIAALWNSLWAIIAWAEVVKTVKDWIIDISTFTDTNLYIYAMLSALLSASLWLNIATFFRAPVSTTHSIVWWVMWAWVAALWINVVNWASVFKIVSSWIISPVIWWIISAIFLFSIKKSILFKENKVSSAKNWVPIFVAIMFWAFTTYLIIKWLKNISYFKHEVSFLNANIIWIVVAIIIWLIMRIRLIRTNKLENNRDSINKLFTIPLIFSVALLTFAQWANDVANAIWPIAAIYDTVISWAISWKVSIPFWILVMWWIGISFGLAVYGPRLIKTVWHEITELDRIRAFVIALASSVTVILASQLWLPVSSTHIAIWWVFWVGFLREYLHKKKHKEKKHFVKRWLIKKIVWAWIITLPFVSFISAMIFLFLTKIFE